MLSTLEDAVYQGNLQLRPVAGLARYILSCYTFILMIMVVCDHLGSCAGRAPHG